MYVQKKHPPTSGRLASAAPQVLQPSPLANHTTCSGDYTTAFRLTRDRRVYTATASVLSSAFAHACLGSYRTEGAGQVADAAHPRTKRQKTKHQQQLATQSRPGLGDPGDGGAVKWPVAGLPVAPPLP
eukprot:SAG22_NODE_6551_length_840_cov_1.442645_2_plen_127_part_01